MGALMAASTLPGILSLNFAGVLIDRSNKQLLMIAMDAIRGAAVVLLAVAAYTGLIEIWMVFAAGILLSACGAVFGPGISSAYPTSFRFKRSQTPIRPSQQSPRAPTSSQRSGRIPLRRAGRPSSFLMNGCPLYFQVRACRSSNPECQAQEKPRFFKICRWFSVYVAQKASVSYLFCGTDQFLLLYRHHAVPPIFSPTQPSVRENTAC
jgi:hypothetical protein